MSKTKEECENCRYLLELDTEVGLCRRYPPIAVPDDESEFPEVWLGGWCGEFVEKPPTDEKSDG